MFKNPRVDVVWLNGGLLLALKQKAGTSVVVCRSQTTKMVIFVQIFTDTSVCTER